MKKLFTLVLLFCSLQSIAQFTLVKEVGTDLEPFTLSNGDWMLFSDIYVDNKLIEFPTYFA